MKTVRDKVYKVILKVNSCYLQCRCSWILSRGEVQRFTEADRDLLVSNVIESMASDGLRTICLAYKNFVTSMHINCL